jgi:hypothetical protein
MVRTVLLPVLGFAIVAGLWVSQCSGPKPTVVDGAHIEAPEQPGDPYKLNATIRNDGPGHGEVRVTFRLIDAASDAAFQKGEHVQLERNETARVVVEISAPPATYRSEVVADYPPE